MLKEKALHFFYLTCSHLTKKKGKYINKLKISFFIFIILFVCTLPIDANGYVNYKIINKPTASIEQILTWRDNKETSDNYDELIIKSYNIAIKYGVDPTVAIAQMSVETNYGRFGGVIDSSYKNTCGMKTTKGGSNKDAKAHHKFNSWEDGINAQMQHLTLYAGIPLPKNIKIVDPRYFKELYGDAVTVDAMSSKWASNTSYGYQINKLCYEIVNTEADEKYSKENESKKTIEDNKTSQSKIVKDKVMKQDYNYLDKIKESMFGRKNNLGIDYIKDLMKNGNK